MTKLKKLLSGALSVLILLPLLSVCLNALTPQAASFADINNPEVFLKQQESDTCTLCANVMMLRRAAIMKGMSNWKDITESSARSTVWVENAGVWLDYTYKGIRVSNDSVASPVLETLKNLLAAHPEGIVASDKHFPHAILLTDYTNGTFYCADPSSTTPAGRIPASKASIKLENVDDFWYVASELPPLQESIELVNNSTLNRVYSVVGQTMVINGKASGGLEPYQYRFSVMTPGSSSYTVVKGYSANNVLSYYPTAIGRYSLKAEVKDGYGNVADKTFTAWLKEADLTNESALSQESIFYGRSVAIHGEALGGTGEYTFAYYYKKQSSTSYQRIGEGFTDTKDVTFKPAAAVPYDIKVVVRDSSGTTSAKVMTLKVSKTPLQLSSSVSSLNLTLGQSVRVSADGTYGFGGYTYAFECIERTDGAAILSGAVYGNTQTAVFKPEKAGKYNVTAAVKDRSGAVVKKTYVVTVNPELVNHSKLSVTQVQAGKKVGIVGYATGGTKPHTYAYYYKKSTSQTWQQINVSETTSSTYFIPYQEGTYQVRVDITDSNGIKRSLVMTVKVTYCSP